MTLDTDQRRSIERGYCPTCNHAGFRLGPRTAASQNIECMGCGSRFNVTMIMGEMMFGETIPSFEAGGPAWPVR